MVTPTLEAEHTRLGAELISIAGTSAPAHYGDWLAEHKAIREAAALIDLSHRRRVRVTGSDRLAFLQRMLTQDIVSMSPGDVSYAVLCTSKGKMIGGLTVVSDEADLLLDCAAQTADTTVAALDRYVIVDDVSFEDVSAETAHLSVQGPLATAVLAKAVEGATLPTAFLEGVRGQIAGLDAFIVCHSRSGEMGFDLYADAASATTIWGALLDAGATPAGQRAADVARVEAGIPWEETELNENVIPVEAGLHHAISYTKGCYVGQEVIAKIKYLGDAPKRLKGLKLDAHKPLPSAGALVFAGDTRVGFVTSATESPTLSAPIGLAFIKTRFAKANTQVSIGDAPTAATQHGTVVDLPIYWGSGVRPPEDS